MKYTMLIKVLLLLCVTSLTAIIADDTLRFENVNNQPIAIKVSQVNGDRSTGTLAIKTNTQTVSPGQVAVFNYPSDANLYCRKYTIEMAPNGQSMLVPAHRVKAASLSPTQWDYDRKNMVEAYKKFQQALLQGGKKIGDPLDWNLPSSMNTLNETISGYLQDKTQSANGFSCGSATYTIMYYYDFATQKWIANLLNS